MRALARCIAAAALGAALYLVLVDTTSMDELYVLAGVGVAAGLAFAATGAEPLLDEISWRRARGIAVALARIPGQLVLLSREALSQLRTPVQRRGAFTTVSFAADDGTRDALAEAAGSLAPNTIVLGADARRGVLIAHQLVPGSDRDEIDVLGVGPP